MAQPAVGQGEISLAQPDEEGGEHEASGDSKEEPEAEEGEDADFGLSPEGGLEHDGTLQEIWVSGKEHRIAGQVGVGGLWSAPSRNGEY